MGTEQPLSARPHRVERGNRAAMPSHLLTRRDGEKATAVVAAPFASLGSREMSDTNLLPRWRPHVGNLLGFLPHVSPKTLCFIDAEGVGRIVVEPDRLLSPADND